MYDNLGVTIYLDDIHVIQFEKMDNVNMLDYDYFLQVRSVEHDRGNGFSEIDIYTKGEKQIIEIGDWKVVPVVKMPFNWSGYSLELKAFDIDSKLFVFKGCPGDESLFKKSNYLKEAEWIIRTIKDLKDVENAYHAELIKKLNDLIWNTKLYSNDYLFIHRLKTIIEETEILIKACEDSNLNDSIKLKLKEGISAIEKIVNDSNITFI